MYYKIIIPSLAAIAIIGTVAVFYALDIDNNISKEENPFVPEKTVFTDLPSMEIFESSEIKKFSSESEVIKFLQAQAVGDSRDFKYPRPTLAPFMSPVELQSRVIADSAMTASSRESASAPEPEPRHSGAFNFQMDESASRAWTAGEEPDFSATNVQVKNVDEPDFLKTDGKYVYIVFEKTLSIIDAYPAEDANIILKIALDIESQNLQNIFLNEDRLVIFYHSSSEDEIIPEFEFVPRTIHLPKTHAMILDVSDKDDPTIVNNYEVDGHFHNARMIDNFVYFVTTNGVHYPQPIIPRILESSGRAMTPDVFYFDNYERDYNFNTLTAIDVFSDYINSETFLMGNANTIYVSEKGFYITYQKNLPPHYYDTLKRQMFFDVVVPLLPKEIQVQITDIQNDPSMDWYQKWLAVSEILEDVYNKMPKNDKEKLIEQIEKELVRYGGSLQEHLKQTVIHKILLDDGNLKYDSKGEVPGWLLNQFSMDENEDRFRVATTNEFYTPDRGTTRYNAVYVLDEKLDIVGKLDRIAPDESIFSARFMGDRLYLVTFEQIDPFFVIDLSQDTPKILGELKIPGFSNYLHPYDDDHIIGVGRDTEEKNGRVTQLGIKIALFDVSNVNKPKVLDDIVIGNRYSHSEALDDHKAFLFDKNKNILSIPIQHTRYEQIDSSITSPERQFWYGFNVYALDTTNGFDLKGEIKHYDDRNNPRVHLSPRSFYIENVLYTVSPGYIKMNDIQDVEEEINSLSLGHSGGLIKYLE